MARPPAEYPPSVHQMLSVRPPNTRRPFIKCSPSARRIPSVRSSNARRPLAEHLPNARQMPAAHSPSTFSPLAEHPPNARRMLSNGVLLFPSTLSSSASTSPRTRTRHGASLLKKLHKPAMNEKGNQVYTDKLYDIFIKHIVCVTKTGKWQDFNL